MEKFETPQPNRVENSEPQKQLQRQLHFDAVELTPEQEFPIFPNKHRQFALSTAGSV